MAGDWMKMRHQLDQAPEVIQIAAALGLDTDQVIGKLYRLWSWADVHASIGQDTHARIGGIDSEWIDWKVGHPGFAKALENVRWLRIVTRKNGPLLMLPRAGRWLGDGAKRRGIQQMRKRHQRETVPQSVGQKEDSSTDQRREEKRREEKKKKPPISPLPKALKTEQFETRWADWLKHRQQLRKPATEISQERALAKLEKLGHDRAIATIDHSIANGWQGLHEPDRADAGGGGNRRPAARRPPLPT